MSFFFSPWRLGAVKFFEGNLLNIQMGRISVFENKSRCFALRVQHDIPANCHPERSEGSRVRKHKNKEECHENRAVG
jgi:hypothetical protein